MENDFFYWAVGITIIISIIFSVVMGVILQ